MYICDHVQGLPQRDQSFTSSNLELLTGLCLLGRTMISTEGCPGGSDGKASAGMQDSGLIPGSGRSLEKGMAPHSSILAWRIQWTGEPGGLQSMRWQRVRDN